MRVPTPHISAKKGDFAKSVLMPGDPYRATYIAENFLTDVKVVTDVRGIKGYTGKYKGKEVSILASGMGSPSIGIYSYELFNGYEVENIIRVGSCGALNDQLKVLDLVIAQGACYEPGYSNQFHLGGIFAPIADYKLLSTCTETCKKLNLNCHIGNVFTSDSFYGERAEITKNWLTMGVLATEMEAAALYMNAAWCGKRALAILTVSDHVFKEEEGLSSKEREQSLNDMITLALETVYNLD